MPAEPARRRAPPRTLEVIRKHALTPHMLRVTLGGPGITGFPEDSDGGYIKIHLGDGEGHSDTSRVRTYTVRRFDGRNIDVDFVLHESDGPAARWAQSCRPGDTIKVGGPGPRKSVDPSADWVLIAGDMSALPAICANIERMSPTAKGFALLEVIGDEDRQDLRAPEGLQVKWLVNPDPETENSVLFDAVRSLAWLPGRPCVWVAGEFNQSLAIRSYLKAEHGVTRDHMYASSYWQIGHTEDGHRINKRNAAED